MFEGICVAVGAGGSTEGDVYVCVMCGVHYVCITHCSV